MTEMLGTPEPVSDLVAGLSAALTEVGEHRRAVFTPGFVWMSWLDGLDVPGMRDYLAGRFVDRSTSAGHLEINDVGGRWIYLNRVLRPATAVLALLRYPELSVRDLFVEHRLPARGLTPGTAVEAIAIDVVLDRYSGEPTGDVAMVRHLRGIVTELKGPHGVLAAARRSLYS
jgi:hypothetical protein